MTFQTLGESYIIILCMLLFTAVSVNLCNSKVNYMFELFTLLLGFDAVLSKFTLQLFCSCVYCYMNIKVPEHHLNS